VHTQVAVSGMRLACEERGTGSPIVLVPGSACDLRVWVNQIEPLSSWYRVIAYSRRYTWPNAGPDAGADASFARQVGDLAGLIKSLGIAPAHIVGHSFGGTIALFLAFEHPELVRSLLLAEPGVAALLEDFPRTDTELDASQNFARALQEAFASGDSAFVVEASFDYVAPGTMPAMSAEIRNMLLGNVPALKVERSTPRPRFTCGDVRRIAVPALVLVGDRSPSAFRRSAEFLAQCFPRSALVSIAGAGHMMQLDNPQAFNESVLAFLATA